MEIKRDACFFKTLLLIFYTVDPHLQTQSIHSRSVTTTHVDLVSYTYTHILPSWHKNAICNILQIYHALGFHYGGFVATFNYHLLIIINDNITDN